jgi:hypothetical protein
MGDYMDNYIHAEENMYSTVLYNFDQLCGALKIVYKMEKYYFAGQAPSEVPDTDAVSVVYITLNNGQEVRLEDDTAERFLDFYNKRWMLEGIEMPNIKAVKV